MTSRKREPSETPAPRRTHPWLSLVAAVAVSSQLVGCSEPSAEQHLEKAKARLAKNEARPAVIELLSALQQNGNLVEARFLLGKALLDSGNAAGALIEFDKAAALGFSAEQITVLRAQALLASGRGSKVVEQYGNRSLKEVGLDAQLKAVVASAHLALGRPELARAGVDAAIAIDSSNADARTLDIRLLAAAGKFDEARARTEKLLTEHPGLARGWLLKAELLRDAPASKPEDVVAAYSEVLKRDARNIAAMSGLVSIKLSSGDIKGAKAQFETLTKAYPDHPETHYQGALIALNDKNLLAAQEHVQAMQKTANSPRAQHLAGVVAFQRGVYPLAQAQLGQALQALPDYGSLRLLLARSFLKGGDPTHALSTLRPLLDSPALTADVLNVAASSSLELGDAKTAESFYRRAVQLNPRNFTAQTSLALARLRGGDARGLEDLRSIAAQDNSNAADMALIAALIGRNDSPRALEAIDALERKEPGGAVAPTLRARVQLQLGQVKDARASFAESLKRLPSYLPAASALAGLDASEGKFEEAIGHMERLLTVDGQNVQARLAVVSLRARAGAKSGEIITLLQNAMAQHRESIEPRLALASEYLRVKKAKEALGVAQNAVDTFPDDARGYELLGGSLAMAGDGNQAMKAYVKMSSLSPSAPLPHLRLAQLHQARNDTTAALVALRRAIELKPGYLPAQIQLSNTLAAMGRHAEARTITSQVQAQHPDDAIGWQLAANVDMVQRNWNAAAANLQQALKRGADSDAAIKMHRTLLFAGRDAEATRFKAQWLNDHDKDSAFLMYLMDRQLSDGNFADAEASARTLIALEPNNPIALNSLAWAIHRQGRAGAAEFIERALKLAPESADLLDTQAAIQAEAGQLDKAIELQKRAVANNADPRFRLPLAKYYAKRGAVREARAELKQLSELGAKFPQQSEVRKLMGSL